MNKIWGTLLIVFILAGCQNEKTIKITGTVSEGKDLTLFLDHLVQNGIENIDSVKLKSNGKFSLKVPENEFAEFYFLRNNKGQTLTILADSASEISIKTSYNKLEADAIVEGSVSTQQLLEFNKTIKKERIAFKKYQAKYDALSDPIEKQNLAKNYMVQVREFKDSLGLELMKNPRSMVSYYVLFQKLTDQYYLYDVYNKMDYRYFATVATALNVYRPEDPRVKAFYEKTLQSLKLQRQERFAERIANAESTIPEIALPNIHGDTMRLSEVTNNKVVILNFWASQSHDSRIWNKTLYSTYRKYKNQGLDIYQVSVDQSKVLWEQAREDDNIIWKSVCDFSGGKSEAGLFYNVRELPTTFIIDRSGDIVARIQNATQLEEEIKKAL